MDETTTTVYSGSASGLVSQMSKMWPLAVLWWQHMGWVHVQCHLYTPPGPVSIVPVTWTPWIASEAGCIGGWLLLLQWTRPSPGPTSPPGPSRIQSRSPARISSGSGDTRGSWLTRTSSCWLAEHQEPSGIKNWSNALKHSDMIFSK